MMTRRSVGASLALPLVLALAARGLAADDPSPPAPSSPQGPASTVWIGGPFGTVAGGPVEQPATAAPDARPLDAWMRGAQLELTADPPLDEDAEVRLVATAADGAAIELPLLDDRWFAAPDQPGLHVITATFGNDPSAGSGHAWLVEVPDREGSWETLLQLPAPEAELRSATKAATGERGHGCYVGMCQEVGYRPPAGALTPLPVSIGEALEFHLSDGSALTHWEGRLRPQPGTAGETRVARMTFDEPVAGPVLTGLEADVAGEWLLELRADYDRDRGWQWFLFRVVAE